MSDPADLTALEARDRVARGALRATELMDACLRRIEQREPAISAFTFLDPTQARAKAAAADALRGTGRPLGPLHGLPIGVKDIIDTADMPTENGTRLDAGRRPSRDAALVARLRAAGGIAIGKTVTTEFAFFHPGKTKNPHDPARTPGGSSSGSAAAVACGMVPLAIGTQTNGSMIRPASFCGVVGFKPTHGLIGRTGVLRHNPWLDTIGTYGRTVEDAALLADALAGHDPGDAQTRPAAPPQILGTALTEPPVTPALAFVKTPAWDKAEPATQEAFAELVAELGKACEEVALPEIFAEGFGAQRRLMYVGFAKNLAGYYDRGKDATSEIFRAAFEEGRDVTAVDYLKAVDWRDALNEGLEPLFEKFDAIVTPAASGEAPVGLQATGDPSFCTLWSLCGTPAVSLPLLQGPNGLPVGVQLVGRRGYDGRLMRTARWLVRRIAAE
jgi:Asp-tRNA(Asn)/Glu-tRNA(Gln) amidotransferase A subunit family amidase